MKWCAGTEAAEGNNGGWRVGEKVLLRLPPQCRCGDLLLIYRRMRRGNHAAKWLPRMDSHHQPPGSEPGALAVELQGKMIRQPELHRSLADTSGVRRYQRFGGI